MEIANKPNLVSCAFTNLIESKLLHDDALSDHAVVCKIERKKRGRKFIHESGK